MVMIILTRPPLRVQHAEQGETFIKAEGWHHVCCVHTCNGSGNRWAHPDPDLPFGVGPSAGFPERRDAKVSLEDVGNGV